MSAEVPEALVRIFVAIELASDVREALARAQTRLQRCGAHVGWVPPANFHLSLAFLGDIPGTRLGALGAALRAALAGTAEFAVRVAGVGSFGSPHSPRVVWAGVEPLPELVEAQRRTAAGVRAVGLALEARPYRPHITLGRVRSGRGREALLAAMAKEGEHAFGTLRATRMVVMQSLLQAQGAQYRVLDAIGFGA